eukprot:TRINITY_DN30450_c0_g2_i1.p1 TRINITY_DN30450_c0_g2~~TRINITY_DN30450_c0_g2_i1.p1  ORF type:complete len:116 (+),score=14.02 TRINITY_DN30450_c0_g2_i1:136-483(+)
MSRIPTLPLYHDGGDLDDLGLLPPAGCILLNSLLDNMRGVLLTGDVQFSLDWIELLTEQSPDAYVVGLGKDRWTQIEMNSASMAARYLKLPRCMVEFSLRGVPAMRRSASPSKPC